MTTPTVIVALPADKIDLVYTLFLSSSPTKLKTADLIPDTTSDTATRFTLYSGVTLYIPLTSDKDASSSFDVSFLVSKLASNTNTATAPLTNPIYAHNASSADVTSFSSFTASSWAPETTLFLPYVHSNLGSTVDFLDLSTSLSSLARRSGATSSVEASPTSTGTTSTGGSIGPSSSSPSPSNGSTASSNLTSPSKPTPVPKPGAYTKAQFSGAVAGGTVGGLVAGIAFALMLIWCLRRRRSDDTRKSAAMLTGNPPKSGYRGDSVGKEMQVLETGSDLTGWQKHLPQDKDDGTIARAVGAMYDQMQIFVEGFYEAQAGDLSGVTVTPLQGLLKEGFPHELLHLSDQSLLLEAILVRWIVHRISLRSAPGESLLPFEFTKLPSRIGWHMEMDGRSNGQVAESRKGFQQAFSQWRMLTGFLCPSPKSDRRFQKQLFVQIDQAVHSITQAFSAWDARGKSIENRNATLRKILGDAGDVGILIFTQQSTFVFDWSEEGRDIIIYPALVKRFDEFGKHPSSLSTLVPARRISVHTQR